MGDTAEKQAFQIDGHYIPVFLHKEVRNSVRFSIGKKGLIIRGPFLLRSADLIDRARKWCRQSLKSNPNAWRNFFIRDYSSPYKISVYDTPFTVHIENTMAKKDTIAWDGSEVRIKLYQYYKDHTRARSIKNLLSKFAAKRFIAPVTEHVATTNQQFFNVKVNRVKLKNNHSNWGSCSAQGNINLSTRLLLAPMPVINYVIIHELAHRLEMNHSKKFWNLVSAACPDYKTYEKWLRTNNHLCHF